MSNDRSARLFLALWPDAATRERLAVERGRWRWGATAALVDDASLHVTLHFIGDVARTLVADLASAIDLDFDPFALAFGRHATWHGGIAVLEPSSSPLALTALHAKLAGRLVEQALTVERRHYRPHVTMARRAAGSTAPSDPPAFVWTVDRYALVESRADGIYEVLRTCPAVQTSRSSPSSASAGTAARTLRP